MNTHPNNPGPAAWNSLLPVIKPRPVLEGSKAVDWLIVGGGFAGLSAARRLKQLCGDDQIAVVEAGRIAQGPAGRNSGFMIDIPHDLASEDYGGQVERDTQQIAANRFAIEFAKAAVHEYDMPKEALRPVGKINAAATDKGKAHNQSYAEHLHALGEVSERFSASDMRALTGSDYYIDGLFTPGTVMIQPALYIREIAEGMEREGVQIYEGSPVQALNKSGATWTAKTPLGKIEAPKVILAVNGHIETMGHYQKKLMHIYTYASMTRALSTDEIRSLGGEAFWSLTPADPLGTTVRRVNGTGGHRIVVRNRATFNPDMIITERAMQSIAERHRKSFESRFPTLSNVEMEYVWGGQLCLSRNDASALGEIDTGLFSACCQNGLGTVRGTLNGILAAEMATKTPLSVPVAQKDLDGPVSLPPRWMTLIGARATLLMKEWHAGKEL